MKVCDRQLDLMKKTAQPETGATKSAVSRLMTFDGTDSWPEYEAHLDEYAKFHQWTDQQKARHLCVSLRGNARSILLELDSKQREDYTAILGALKRHFCPAEKVFVYQAELQNRRLQPEEELSELARDIRTKTRLAYPSADQKTLETLMKTHFCNGLTNRDMRLTVLKSHPETITQALAYATEYDSIMKTDGSTVSKKGYSGRQAKGEEEPEDTELRKQVKGLQQQSQKQLTELLQAVQQMSAARASRPRKPKAELRCYQCGAKGHFANECPDRPKEPETNQQN